MRIPICTASVLPSAPADTENPVGEMTCSFRNGAGSAYGPVTLPWRLGTDNLQPAALSPDRILVSRDPGDDSSLCNLLPPTWCPRLLRSEPSPRFARS
jgi:hypothetical protein